MAAKAAGTWRAIGYGDIGKPNDLTQIDTTAAYALGTTVRAIDEGSTAYGEGTFMYVKGVASTVAKDVVVVKASDFSIVRVTARSVGTVGLTLSALDAATKYGWIQIRGTLGVANAASVAADLPAYATGAGGVGTIDDTVVTGDQIVGMQTASTTDTGTCLVSFPNGAVMNDIDNS